MKKKVLGGKSYCSNIEDRSLSNVFKMFLSTNYALILKGFNKTILFLYMEKSCNNLLLAACI